MAHHFLLRPEAWTFALRCAPVYQAIHLLRKLPGLNIDFLGSQKSMPRSNRGFALKAPDFFESPPTVKLTNLSENFSMSELIDNCLAKNQKKTVLILNENRFGTEDCIQIIRMFQ